MAILRSNRRLRVERLDDRIVPSVGGLDPSFSQDGLVQTHFGAAEDGAAAQSVLIQPNGRIVVGGYHRGPDGNDFALARYSTAGAVDWNFSFDGKATTDFAGGMDYITALALQSDGKIIAVGAAQSASGSTSDFDFAMARYNPDGSVDLAFGPDNNGRVTANFFGGDDVATGIAIRPDGSIVVGGWCTLPGTSTHQFAMLCLAANGLPDIAFGPNGN